ncbi:MAG: prolyl oligopeptidase family serine peptidase [Planctomycetes bacterium]|nr:prolyl oligopeptidase family serine peptidase [Planctomycetota bacterium]
MNARAHATHRRRNAAVLLAAALAAGGAGLPSTASGQEISIPWPEMEKFFVPPEEHKGKLGSYRSPMRFDDGTPVKTRQDWSRRREEIRAYWHRVMGPWPALVEKPRIKDLEKEHVESFTRRKVQVEVAPETFAGTQYLLVPDGRGPFPAVLVTWYGSEDSAGLTEKARGTVDFGLQLARRGFVALCLGAVRQEDAPPSGGRSGIQPVQPLSFLAYAAANCCNALAALPEVDPKRIGVMGHSFGGKWAMFASCLHDGFACAVWSDPGIVWNEEDPNANYWEKWYLGYRFDRPADGQRKPGIPTEAHPRTGAYERLVAEGRDLHELHALMAPRPFLVSGGAQDRPEHWRALNHAIALDELLGHTGRVAMTLRDGHTPTAESNAQACAFLEHFLKGR